MYQFQETCPASARLAKVTIKRLVIINQSTILIMGAIIAVSVILLGPFPGLLIIKPFVE